MRILQVTDGYWPLIGGMERVVEALATELADRGHDSHVATFKRPESAAVEVRNGVRVHRIEGFTRYLRRFKSDPAHDIHPTVPDPALVRKLQKLVDTVKPDIVHAHGWILHSCLSLRLPVGTALVHTLHDYGLVCAKKTLLRCAGDTQIACDGPQLGKCLKCTRQFYGAVKGSVLTIGLQLSSARLHRVSMFIPISAAVEAVSLRDAGTDLDTVIPSFVADSVFQDAAGAPPEFLPAGPFVLFVGQLGEHKGVSLLAEAHRRMRHPVPLVYIGPDCPDTPVLTGTADRPVHVYPPVPHRQIMAAMKAATVTAVPSRCQEGLGLVAVEAMAAGTPPVVTAVGGLPEVVIDGRTGLVVQPDDPAALAIALDRVIADPGFRDRLAAAGIRRAREFTASAVVPRIIEAYGIAARTDAAVTVWSAS